MKAQEFRQMSIEELQEAQIRLARELFNARNQLQKTKRLDNPNVLRNKRRERARVLTILREKQLNRGN